MKVLNTPEKKFAVRNMKTSDKKCPKASRYVNMVMSYTLINNGTL